MAALLKTPPPPAGDKSTRKAKKTTDEDGGTHEQAVAMTRKRIWAVIVLMAVLPSCGGRTPTAPEPTPAVTYSVTGTAMQVTLGYTVPVGSIYIDPNVKLPFTYTWASAQPGAHLLLSAHIDTPGDTGNVRVSIMRNGIEIRSDTATGFPNRAEVSVRPIKRGPAVAANGVGL